MDTLPAPLVPAEVDLRGYEFMPLYGDRLFKSQTWIAATAEAKVAALRLWWHAFAHEVPAASLPTSDTLLAEYAGYGVSVKAWLKVKTQALRGFITCSDGRLYHEQVAAFAMDAWARRQQEIEKQKNERDRKHRQREDRKALFDQLRSLGLVPPFDTSTTALRDMLSHATSAGSHADVPRKSAGSHADVPGTVTAKTGQDRTGEDRTYKENQNLLSGKPDPRPPNGQEARTEKLRQLRAQAISILEFLNEKTGRNYDATNGPNVDMVVARLKQGATPEKCQQVIALMARKWRGDEKMDQYLRPKTLFNATNFAQYAGEIVEQPGGDE